MDILKSHGFLLNRLSNSASALLEKRLIANYDITLSQWTTISILGESEGMTSSEIQKILNIKVSSASGILKRMENKQLINIVYNHHDKREKNLFLTEKALALRPLIVNEVKQFNNELLANFTEEEKKLFKRLINKAFETIVQ